MEKYSRLRDLVSELPNLFLIEAPAASDTQLLYAHDASYLLRVTSGKLSDAEQKEIGFPWSEKMVERSRRSAGATIAATKSAMQEGISGNLAGGTHHAYRNRGSGFCVFNDAAVAARTLQKEVSSKLKVAIIDLDVHQGNGTAKIFESDDRVFTFSMHGQSNYPLQKEQSLVTDDTPTQKQLDWAAGYGVCDACSMNDPSLQRFRGFAIQTRRAAGIMRY
ncbi:MAG: hypothetical protein RJB15_518, partial [Pseudomonadota bacterium]